MLSLTSEDVFVEMSINSKSGSIILYSADTSFGGIAERLTLSTTPLRRTTCCPSPPSTY
jgi:hypothetical protein